MRPRRGRGTDGHQPATPLNLAQWLITGCSGGGKSTLIAELARQGHATVREPGLRVIANGVTPWDDPAAFLRETERLSRADLAAAANGHAGPVFFDRGLLDAILAAERAGGPRAEQALAGQRPYVREVFFAPQWPQIYRRDDTRRHSIQSALAETEHLRRRLPELGYRLLTLPKASIAQRARFVLDRTGIPS